MSQIVAEADRFLSREFDRFCRLAVRGKNRGASGGEKRARKLAMAVLDEASGLDDQAIEGLITFIRAVQRAPTTARDLVQGWE
jgi:hypothetical protein